MYTMILCHVHEFSSTEAGLPSELVFGEQGSSRTEGSDGGDPDHRSTVQRQRAYGCGYNRQQHIIQVAQPSQRDRAAVRVSCGPNNNIVFRIQRTLP